MTHIIRFERDNSGYTTDPLVDLIRIKARAKGWTGMSGFKEWAKETYNATLRTGIYHDWTSISFKNNHDMKKFEQDFKLIDYIRENIVEYTAMTEQQRLEWVRTYMENAV
jgi:hypothetical protein